jgi:hypothetical protein
VRSSSLSSIHLGIGMLTTLGAYLLHSDRGRRHLLLWCLQSDVHTHQPLHLGLWLNSQPSGSSAP